MGAFALIGGTSLLGGDVARARRAPHPCDDHNLFDSLPMDTAAQPLVEGPDRDRAIALDSPPAAASSAPGLKRNATG
jgi:hypothetical protein